MTALDASRANLDRFWFDWRGGRCRVATADYDAPEFAPFVAALEAFAPAAAATHPYWSDRGPCGLPIAEIEAIWARIAAADDWTAFDAKVAAIRRMGEAMDA